MKHEITSCPTCGKALARCTDMNLLPESVKAINTGYGWAWDEKQCKECHRRLKNEHKN